MLYEEDIIVSTIVSLAQKYEHKRFAAACTNNDAMPRHL